MRSLNILWLREELEVVGEKLKQRRLISLSSLFWMDTGPTQLGPQAPRFAMVARVGGIQLYLLTEFSLQLTA